MLLGQQKFPRSNLGTFYLLAPYKNMVLILPKPIRVAPEAYYLFDAPAVGVPELCDAFKVR